MRQGIHVFGQWLVKDCFLRTQDDSIYLQAGSASSCPTFFEGITTWNDANGAAFMLIGHHATLRASDAIYQRASWGWWDGGRILTNREQGATVGVTVDDLVASDPFPTMNALNFDTRPGSSSGSPHAGPSTFANVSIRNLHVAAFSTQRVCPGGKNPPAGCSCVPACASGPLPFGVPNRILGGPARTNNISSIAFENCTIGGVGVGELLRGGAFNVSWAAVRGITVDGAAVGPPDPCMSTLRSLCSTDKVRAHSPFSHEPCAVCAGQLQHQLMEAGCTHAEIQKYCSEHDR